MSDSTPQPTPMLANLKLTENETTSVPDPSFYRSIVGALQYLTITRPDVSFAVNKVCQYMHCPQEHHWKAVKRILRYLQGTIHHGLLIQKNKQLNLAGFCDSDWGNDKDDRKSTSGYCVYLGSNLISWSSRKQKSVSRSTTEAEYRSIADVAADIIWIQSLLSELRVPKSLPRIYCDNLSAVLITANPVLHSKTKHFELDLHFVRDKVKQNEVRVIHLPAEYQVADTLTKPLAKQHFHHFRNKLMVTTLDTMSLRGDVKGNG
uniref:Copia protein n=1 Tax=Cajanus cajan TaxID=3821 RepID=A0A151RNH7_CAJCA|nr:hypothetical protein KK1_034411 [Cajanus cajan]